MKNLLNFGFIAVLLFAFTACSDDDANNNQMQTSRVMVSLTDAPGDYDSVFVDVQDVLIKYKDSADVSLGNINTGVYDLLQLTGGLSVLLADEEIPSGEVTQMRLVLGENNSIVVDGESYPLQTPSAQQSGLKLQINQTLEEGVTYDFMLDFDVDKSIVVQGNGNYLLKPVIRIVDMAVESGMITGTVIPLGFQTLVTATDGTETISAFTNADGEFVLNGVPEGTYTVTIEPDPTSGYADLVINDVEVVNGEVTDMGTIDLDI